MATRTLHDPAVAARVRQYELAARAILSGWLSGSHRSAQQGLAIEFAQHREYVPGDDFKHIDWKVYGRTERYYLKQYEQETNVVGWMAIDATASMRFGSPVAKYDRACIAASALAMLLLNQGDQVGLARIAGDAPAITLPPSGRGSAIVDLQRALAELPAPKQTGFAEGLLRWANQRPRRGLTMLFSDALDELPAWEAALKRLRHDRHEVVLFRVLDAAECDFPMASATKFLGLEEPDEIQADPRSIRAAYLKAFAEHEEALQQLSRSLRVELVLVRSDADLGLELGRYLAARAGRRGSR